MTEDSVNSDERGESSNNDSCAIQGVGCLGILAIPLAVTWWNNGPSWWNWLLIPVLILLVLGLAISDSNEKDSKNSAFGMFILAVGLVVALVSHSPSVEEGPVSDFQFWMNECVPDNEAAGSSYDVAYADCVEAWKAKKVIEDDINQG